MIVSSPRSRLVPGRDDDRLARAHPPRTGGLRTIVPFVDLQVGRHEAGPSSRSSRCVPDTTARGDGDRDELRRCAEGAGDARGERPPADEHRAGDRMHRPAADAEGGRRHRGVGGRRGVAWASRAAPAAAARMRRRRRPSRSAAAVDLPARRGSAASGARARRRVGRPRRGRPRRGRRRRGAVAGRRRAGDRSPRRAGRGERRRGRRRGSGSAPWSALAATGRPRGIRTVSASAAEASGRRGTPTAAHSTADARRLARACGTGSVASPSRPSGASVAVTRMPTTAPNSARCHGRMPRESNRRVPPGEVRSTTASPRTTAVTSEVSRPGHHTNANESTGWRRRAGRGRRATRSSRRSSAAAVASADEAGVGRRRRDGGDEPVADHDVPRGCTGTAALVTVPATMSTSLAPPRRRRQPMRLITCLMRV